MSTETEKPKVDDPVLTNKIVAQIKRCLVLKYLYGLPNCSIDTRQLYTDGRGREGKLKKLIETGYVVRSEKIGSYVQVTDKMWHEIVPDDLSPVTLWDRQNRKNGVWDNRHNWPYVRIFNKFDHDYVGDVTPNECRGFITSNSPGLRWAVVDMWFINHNYGYNPKTHADKIYGEYETLEEAQKRYLEVTKDRTGDIEILVTSQRLKDHVADIEFDWNLDNSYKSNLSWGLAKLGILTEEDADTVKSNGDKFGISMLVGRGGVNVGDDPYKWGEDLGVSLDRAVAGLGELSRKIATIMKIQKGIVLYGGWEKFRADYRAALKAELKKRAQTDQ
jgi:hypothetical protein